MSTEHPPAGEQVSELSEHLNTAANAVVRTREDFEQAVLDAHLSGMTNVEIAKHVGRTEGAIRAILKRLQA
ncbi:HTH DNA binding protein [Arthrobacter phage Piccoletto]|uniref:Helix-turn-helix DNA binding domain protein n=3 Tax=Jawnskivirus TaxID=3425003 RepID=A0A222ZK09_9CAUD|nr:HTH DNA binding protein [Arthrobacter phage Jawnski]YP_009609977.1 HTH DNA binding protein [Arthrobacter phage Beans]YP_009612415.1 HTH DNA binding protein [Arthrobacter phage Piccoletto]UVK62288.1 DNA binding domain protein [Arthrobacter phage NathanVaag]ALY09366.1 helix-turn-helix DNA binding domain protein [Arthrobacter phage Jawnski]ASR80667.1 helix-turn-helix DNA binding domain protein [Arthrobacter phage Piccoletto]ASR84745.1 helix-turn-helix DNA binding domain protein [Arthrobacter 